ncbi:MAG TPA: glycosyltransferase, partial [Mycoplana sp.]|nr:glycosyltransferase [Mycoplana sp.]
MLTVLMECHNNEAELAQTLSALVAGAVEGLVRDVIVLDHGSSDGSSRVA